MMSLSKDERPHWLPSEGDRQTGVRSRHPVDALDALRDAASEAVEVLRLQLHDDVVGAGDGVDGLHRRVRVLEIADLLADALGGTDGRLHENVAAHAHPSPPSSLIMA